MIPTARTVRVGKRLRYFIACRAIRENLCRTLHWYRRRWVAERVCVWCPICDAPSPDELAHTRGQCDASCACRRSISKHSSDPVSDLAMVDRPGMRKANAP